MEHERLRTEAWLGDAVLALFARQYILKHKGVMDGDTYARMTSNQFLSAFGEPTAVEAELGRVYRDEGLDVAFQWIRQRILPRFEREEANRQRR